MSGSYDLWTWSLCLSLWTIFLCFYSSMCNLSLTHMPYINPCIFIYVFPTRIKAVPLSEKQRSVKTQAQHAWPISKLSSATISAHQVLFMLGKHHVSATGLASACVSADITLPISLSPRKQQETVAHHHKFFGAFLYGAPTHAAQLRNVR